MAGRRFGGGGGGGLPEGRQWAAVAGGGARVNFLDDFCSFLDVFVICG